MPFGWKVGCHLITNEMRKSFKKGSKRMLLHFFLAMACFFDVVSMCLKFHRFTPFRSFQVCSRGSPSIATSMRPSWGFPVGLRTNSLFMGYRYVKWQNMFTPYLFFIQQRKTTRSLNDTTRSFTICRLDSPCCLRFCELSMSLPRSAGESNARFHPHKANK